MGRVPAALFLVLAPPAFGLIALALPMDANWDLRNYHYYNAYAFLAGREGYDLLVAQLPSFFNPLVDLPFFLAAQAWPARLLGFALGTVQGLNILPLYGISHAVLRIAPVERRRLVAAASALLGMTGAGALSELGTTFQDNIVSLGPLAALWLIMRDYAALRQAPLRAIWLRLVLAGLLSGVAVGLKQPIVTLVAGLCLAFLFAPAWPARRLALALLFGAGVTLGAGAASGHWMLHLWRAYGNPIFPFYNEIFGSPWALAKDYRDVFYIPGSWLVRLFFPFAYLANPRLTAEADFRDLRILACFVLIPLAGATVLLRQPRHVPEAGSLSAMPETRYLLTAFAIGYALWVLLFCIYRYLVVYEMLAPLAIMLSIGLLPLRPRTRALAAAAALALVAVTVEPADWGRIPWTAKWVMATPPVLADPDRTIVLITGHEPLSYLIPFFPPSVRFLRIHSGFTGPYEPTMRFNVEMHRIVEAHRGPLYALFNPNETGFANTHLAAYGLAIDASACRTVPSNIGYLPYSFCALRRQSPSPTEDRML